MTKNILSNIIVAKKQNKKIIKIKHKKYYNKLLNLLWNEGLILGYQIKVHKKYCFFHKIFIKYSNKNYCLLKRINFLNSFAKNKTLQNLKIIEKNYIYLLMNDKGFFSQKNFSVSNFGGFLFVKI
jgi:ribosomal protein S8